MSAPSFICFLLGTVAAWVVLVSLIAWEKKIRITILSSSLVFIVVTTATLGLVATRREQHLRAVAKESAQAMQHVQNIALMEKRFYATHHKYASPVALQRQNPTTHKGADSGENESSPLPITINTTSLKQEVIINAGTSIPSFSLALNSKEYTAYSCLGYTYNGCFQGTWTPGWQRPYESPFSHMF